MATPLAEQWATSHQAPLWVAVALYAVAHADSNGIAALRPHQLRRALAPGARPQVLSAAIRRAVAAGWLHDESTAYRLRVQGGRGGAPVGMGGGGV